MHNERYQSQACSKRSSISSQNQMLMDSPRINQINNSEYQNSVRSPQTNYDIISLDQNPLNLSRQVSECLLFLQQPFILRSGRMYNQKNQKQDQTQDQKEDHLGLQNQDYEKCFEEVDQCLNNVNIEIREKSQEKQAFKFSEKKLNKASENQQQPCNCKHSGCLKRYCRCFHSGRVCLPECQCSDGCLNIKDNILERSKAIQHVNEKCYRNKKLPRDSLFKLDIIYGCSCTKSKCKKRYCECFLRNQNCTEFCKCFNCCNKSNVNSSK